LQSINLLFIISFIDIISVAKGSIYASIGIIFVLP